MIPRPFANLPPRITFTADFHELVRGNLQPGQTVTLRYDPRRIVPAGEHYVFGDPTHRITAHLLFPPTGVVAAALLSSPSGMLNSPDYDETGDGSVLVGHVVIPAGARELVAWFEYESPHGAKHYDSDFGHNFHFGFASLQVELLQADVREGLLTAQVAASPEVDRLVLHWRIVGQESAGPKDVDLVRTDRRNEAGWPIWKMGQIEVPENAVVRLKLYYWIDGERYKDDNDGLYYSTGRMEEVVPPPPAELATALREWTTRLSARF
ncbi:hypothetical protein MAMC_01550 [Methylacidimicrobium cyclopophantes]|uniref:Uncharacterized protein n=1 Tax=Methylacidimicrobium cyclopophantes TaxID=1041766 RepID=A0A5E6MEA3_9BACT|nr:DUF6209 family protein [Methylacidimicrobium cyclopophantes]VVM07304.1 hypothetical protein MAMC_01550 [Methylacidimicrobium cyclopophantes]